MDRPQPFESARAGARRATHKLTRAALAVALFAAFLTILVTMMPSAHAQAEETPPPTATVDAARADLAARSGIDVAQIELLRGVAVTWNDACLGAGGGDEACAQFLVDGFVLWLTDGSGSATRYHTDVDGTDVRFAEDMISLDDVRGAALPTGATPRPTLIEVEPIAVPSSVGDFLAALQAAGLPAELQEIAIQRDGIPVPSAGQIPAGSGTIEVYDLGSPAAVETTIDGFSSDAGSPAPANATLWASGSLIVILIGAPSNPEIESALFNILGGPVIATITGTPLMPLPPPDDGDVAPEAPVALPATGSAGIADAGSRGEWLWGVVAATVALLALGGYWFERRLRWDRQAR